MGIWGYELFENDIACDVRDTYLKMLEKWGNGEQACLETYKEYSDVIGSEEEYLFWWALADTQWECGRLCTEVKKHANKWLDAKSLNSKNGKKDKKIEEIMRLKNKIKMPIPPKKVLVQQKKFATNIWNVGDVYVYQFNTNIAKEKGLKNFYIPFQKIGNVIAWDKQKYSIVQVLDGIFPYIPSFQDVQGLGVLPQVYPPGMWTSPNNIRDFVPSFEYYTKAFMILDKEEDYPRKYFTYIGQEDIKEIHREGNEITSFFLEQEEMEEWLCEFYLSWQEVDYQVGDYNKIRGHEL